jgi:hypothetical protein
MDRPALSSTANTLQDHPNPTRVHDPPPRRCLTAPARGATAQPRLTVTHGSGSSAPFRVVAPRLAPGPGS